MLRDCNTCRFHEQGRHPAHVIVDSDDFVHKTCADCLDGKNLPLWAPRAEKVTVHPATVVASPSGGVKADAGKVGVHLLPTRALEEIAKVLDFGAKKYAAHNWRKGIEWSRVLGALLRHVFAWARGIDKDPETGLSHLAHAGCCVLFLLQYVLEGDKYKQFDDRYREA